MTLKDLSLAVGLTIGLAACAPTTPCPCAGCEPIGWGTAHYTGTCAPVPPPPPPPAPPPPPRTEYRGG